MLQRAPQVLLQARLLPRPIKLTAYRVCFAAFSALLVIHLKDSSVMLRAIALISSVWHLSSGLLLLLLLFIVQLSNTKLMSRILSPCFTCMFEPTMTFFLSTTSIVMTVLRSIGNEHLVPCRLYVFYFILGQIGDVAFLVRPSICFV
ncbi:hypothetical protein L1987_63296 [Smallanthus sonchifolius]|uniref:Uncharacterized protein n=1 Tax=Smallanthus sonchifolius TaxID=185202 RepID=A0ACB9CCV8_9ASTR|nr:hypothetical protein L1987_63296 [Smallanthus sonchifolius]